MRVLISSSLNNITFHVILFSEQYHMECQQTTCLPSCRRLFILARTAIHTVSEIKLQNGSDHKSDKLSRQTKPEKEISFPKFDQSKKLCPARLELQEP